ncbi:MAG: SIS domain-containing protein [Lentisphaeria bacterium]|nr:SIS domain-containing protein [Lentisphaeria bacterium]
MVRGTSFEELCLRSPELGQVAQVFGEMVKVCRECLEADGTLYLAGNGGSRADADHIAGELMKGFLRQRRIPTHEALQLEQDGNGDGRLLGERLQRGLRALVLGSCDALSTAVANDTDADLIFAQPLYVLGRARDVLLAISTSGNARNVLLACRVARLRGMRTIALTGQDGGTLRSLADVCLRVPATETYRVQELHLPLYHCLCATLEEAFFPE